MSSPHHTASNPFSKNFVESGKIDQSMGSSMGDSGVDSLILSQQGSLLGSSQPTVQMPSAVTAASAAAAAIAREDSGLSAELSRLNLSAAAKGEDAWKEYYEPDEDGDVQLHMAIASGYVEVVDALIRMCPHPEYLSVQNNASFAPLHIAVLQNQPVMARKGFAYQAEGSHIKALAIHGPRMLQPAALAQKPDDGAASRVRITMIHRCQLLSLIL